MAHVLIIKSAEHPELVQGMFQEVLDVVAANGHTYDQLTVPSTKELPITLNLYSENLIYESIICIGALIDEPDFALNEIHAREIIRSLHEYTIYYATPVGVAVVCCKSSQAANIQSITQYAHTVARNTIDMMQTLKQLNSLDLDKYVKTHQHN